MKKTFLTSILCLILFSGWSQPINVTFRVDMTYQNVSTNGVHVAGNFQDTAGFASNWLPGATVLVDSNNTNIYEVTVSIPSGTYQYKFINGNVWGNDESVPQSCGFGSFPFNRQVTIGTTDTILPAICFAQCTVCPTTEMVTFQVDMRNEIIDTNGVYVVGDFQVAAGYISNWDPTSIQLTDLNNDSIYETTVNIPSGSYQYKFINGNSFAGEENVPSSCGVSNGLGGYNRAIAIAADTTIPEVCFNSCLSCSAPPTPIYNVTFKLDMQTYTGSFNNAFVSGSFNGWNGTLDTLLDLNGDTVFEKTIQLAAGNYEYKFQLDNWTIFELFTGSEPCVIQNSGNINRVITISGDTTLGELCFNSCVDCPTATPTFYQVVFNVNMNDYASTFSKVYVSGEFNNWCGSCDELKDLDFDGIYSDTIMLPADTFQYKFNLDNWAISEIFTGAEACTDTFAGIANRYFNFNSDTVLPQVCFNSCSSCPPRPQFTTTFITDMKHNLVDSNGLFIYGSFNNYDLTNTPLQSFGDSLYGVTLTLDSGKTVYYRYLNGNSPEQTNGNCFTTAPNGITTRSQNINQNNDTILLCFNECDTCSSLPSIQYYNVTFRVGMYGQNISSNGVHVAGNFQTLAGFPNNWDPSSTQMQDLDGDSIYELTLILPADTFEYKFINGNTWNNAEIVPQTCGVGISALNREIEFSSDTVLKAVCFSSCKICPQSIPPTLYPITFKVDMRLENISPDGVHLVGDFSNWTVDSIPMINNGKGLFEVTLNLDSGQTFQYKFINGNSFAGEENVPALCGVPNGLGNFNREVTVSNPTVLDSLCFGKCLPCNLASLNQINLGLKVDMSDEIVDASGVFIAGSFNNWTLEPMSPIGNNIYSINLSLDSNAIFEFKFYNGNNPGVSEVVPQACGTPDGQGGFNRSIFTFGSINLNEVCFSSCAVCVSPPSKSNVTFRVSMKNNAVSNFGLNVAGNFNNYNPNEYNLTDANSDTIYQVTISLNQGESILYNYYNGVTLANKEKTDSLEVCGIKDGFGNIERNFIVPNFDTTLNVVCYSRCTDCKPSNNIGVKEQLKSNLNVKIINGNLSIQNSDLLSLKNITIFDVTGKAVFYSTLQPAVHQIVDLNFIRNTGIYFYSINIGSSEIKGKLFIQP
jgi:hypothetical protein